jgi:membrane protein DedA with SNARE-associated domain
MTPTMNLATAGSTLTLLSSGGYFLMFILMIVEGPIVTYLSSFAAATGVFSFAAVFCLSISAAICGDMFVFFIGRHGGQAFLKKHGCRLSDQNRERIAAVHRLVDKHPGKAIGIAKVTPGLPVPAILVIGTAGIPARTFFKYSIMISAAYTGTFSVIGYYSGITAGKILSFSRIEGLLVTAIAIGAALWFLSRYAAKKLSGNLQNGKTSKRKTTAANNKPSMKCGAGK